MASAPAGTPASSASAPGNADWNVEFVAHASIRVRGRGKTLLTDPWYTDPVDCNATFHWPPIACDVAHLAQQTDVIWISHVHPDHLDPRTLAHFPRSVPIYLGQYARKGFRDSVARMGFTVHEVPFQQPTAIPGTDFTIAILESDYGESAAYDSSIVIRTPHFTVFDNNDCHLEEAKYRWVARNFAIDYAFLGYSPASYFPVCFEFDAPEKNRLLRESAERRYGDFVEVARLLQPRLSIPFAMGIRFLHRSMLWKNVQFNRAQEAVRRGRAAGLECEALLPGDRILVNGALERNSRPMTEAEEDDALIHHADRMAPWVESIWDAEPPARPGLVASFAAYMTDLWKRSRPRFPSVGDKVIAFRVEGAHGGDFHFDFSRDENAIFAAGIPDRFDMRYVYPDNLLQLRLDGGIDWDELHFSNRVSVKQHRYAADYYAMLRSHEDSRGEEKP